MYLNRLIYNFNLQIFKRSKIDKVREELISKAYGHVLEIGSGTGVNFPLYRNATKVTALEPNKAMRHRSISKREMASTPITVCNAVAESLPFANDSCDTVVCSLVFCTINDPIKSIEEIIRVAKKDAIILFLEHVEMKNSFLAKLQHLATPIWRRLANGCHLNRDTLTLIEQSGLRLIKVNKYYKGLLITVTCKNNC